MAKYNFNLRKVNTSSSPINFIIRWNNKRLVYPTGETVNPKYWEQDKTKSDFQRAINTRKFPEHNELNSRLDKLESTSKEIYRRYINDHNKEPTVEVFRDLLNEHFFDSQKVKLDFFDFFLKFISESKTRTNIHTGRIIAPSTIKIYNNTIKHLKNYSVKRKKRIDFDTIDLDFYYDFSEYLTVDLGFATNTIGRVIKVVKTVLNEATERGVNTNMAFKSKRFRVISEKIDNVYLTENELNDLYHIDLSEDTRLERVRDLFLIGCYTGLRFSDFTQLRPSNIKGGFIEIETQKTADNVVIPLHPKVDTIMKRYNGQLPPSISNQKMNGYLKEVCSLVDSLQVVHSLKSTKGGVVVHRNLKKFELISTHSARRSYATNRYLEGVPSIVIMGVTGHKTEEAFMLYLKITSNEKAKILEMYMNKHNNLKAV